MKQWNPKASPQATATFIEEVLNQLAELAAALDGDADLGGRGDDEAHGVI